MVHSSIFITSDNKVLSCGNNLYGQLGLGITKHNNPIKGVYVENEKCCTSIPKLIPNLNDIKYYSISSEYTLFLDINGDVHITGRNKPHSTSTLSPTIFEKGKNIAMMKANKNNIILNDAKGHSYFYTYTKNPFIFDLGSTDTYSCDNYTRYIKDNKVWTYDYMNKKNKKIMNVENITDISYTEYATLLLDCDANVWQYDENNKKISIIKDLPSISVVKNGLNKSLFLDYDGYAWELVGNTPKKININERIIDIDVIEDQQRFLDSNGMLWISGKNECGQLGLGHTKMVNNPTLNTNLPQLSLFNIKNFNNTKSAMKI